MLGLLLAFSRLPVLKEFLLFINERTRFYEEKHGSCKRHADYACRGLCKYNELRIEHEASLKRQVMDPTYDSEAGKCKLVGDLKEAVYEE